MLHAENLFCGTTTNLRPETVLRAIPSCCVWQIENKNQGSSIYYIEVSLIGSSGSGGSVVVK